MLQPFYGLASGLYSYPDSIYHTCLSFLHRLTIPAFKVYVLSHYVYNLFSVEIYKLHDVSTIMMALLILSRLEVLRRIFAVIFLVIVYSLSHNRHG